MFRDRKASMAASTAALARLSGGGGGLLGAAQSRRGSQATVHFSPQRSAKHKREARYVHGAAWTGILFGAAVSVGLIIVLPGWTKVFAILFLIVGSYYIASDLGNVAVQDYAYRRGLQQFSIAWQEFLELRTAGVVDED